jgi:hypothetical protein
MVVKILFIISLTLFSLNSFSNETGAGSLDLKANSMKLSGIQYWSNKKVILSGFEGNFSLVELQSTTPMLVSEVRQRKFPFASQYSVSLLDKGLQVLYEIPIGDPFNLYAEHLGYEGERAILPITNPSLEIPIPTSVNPVFVRLNISKSGEVHLGEELEIYRR